MAHLTAALTATRIHSPCRSARSMASAASRPPFLRPNAGRRWQRPERLRRRRWGSRSLSRCKPIGQEPLQRGRCRTHPPLAVRTRSAAANCARHQFLQAGGPWQVRPGLEILVLVVQILSLRDWPTFRTTKYRTLRLVGLRGRAHGPRLPLTCMRWVGAGLGSGPAPTARSPPRVDSSPRQ